MYSSWTSETGSAVSCSRRRSSAVAPRRTAQHERARRPRSDRRRRGRTSIPSRSSAGRATRTPWRQRFATTRAASGRIAGRNSARPLAAASSTRSMSAISSTSRRSRSRSARAGSSGAVGSGEAELIEREIARVVVAAVELVERGVEKAAQPSVRIAAAHGERGAGGVEGREQLVRRRSACRPGDTRRRRRRRGTASGSRSASQTASSSIAISLPCGARWSVAVAMPTASPRRRPATSHPRGESRHPCGESRLPGSGVSRRRRPARARAYPARSSGVKRSGSSSRSFAPSSATASSDRAASSSSIADELGPGGDHRLREQPGLVESHVATALDVLANHRRGPLWRNQHQSPGDGIAEDRGGEAAAPRRPSPRPDPRSAARGRGVGERAQRAALLAFEQGERAAARGRRRRRRRPSSRPRPRWRSPSTLSPK